jgi:diguanylate cyclase (GGDEF)-like protein
MLKSGRHAASFYREMWGSIAAGREWRGEICNRTKAGREYWAMTSISPVLDGDGRIVNYIGVSEDITQKILQEQHIRFLALHDPLTGLANRNLFIDRLSQAVSYAERHGTSAVLMYIDLDDFKDVNDTYGHEAGDTVLKEVGRRLLTCIRSVDSVARVGGDEFVIILQDMTGDREVEQVVRRVRERIALPVELGEGRTCRVGASLGMSVCPDDGKDVDTLLRKADLAMYAVKKSHGQAGAAEGAAEEPAGEG